MSDSQTPEKPVWTLIELKEKIIDDGLAEVREAYVDDEAKREGAISGFEIARSLTSREEFENVIRHRLAREVRMRPWREDPDATHRYWAHRYGTLQLEWVLDCLKVAYWAREGEMLSSRAMRKVMEVVS